MLHVVHSRFCGFFSFEGREILAVDDDDVVDVGVVSSSGGGASIHDSLVKIPTVIPPMANHQSQSLLPPIFFKTKKEKK